MFARAECGFPPLIHHAQAATPRCQRPAGWAAARRLPGAGVAVVLNLCLGLIGGGLGALIARGARPAPVARGARSAPATA